MYRMTLLKAGGLSTPPAFTPLSISNLRTWYAANLGVTLNGATVSQWDDQSGNGNHLSQSTAANQPLFSANTINTLPSIYFDGTNDYLKLPANITGITDTTVFVVEKLVTGGTAIQPILTNDGANGSYGKGSLWEFSTATSIGENILYVPPAYDTWFLRSGSGVFSTANTINYVNGASVGTVTGDNGSTTWAIFGYVGRGGAGGFYSKAYIAEILIYSRLLTPTERGDVTSFLNSKYAIY